MTQTIVWRGVSIDVDYEPRAFNTDFGHITFKADRPLPFTNTGYWSHWIHEKEMEFFEDAADFILQWLDVQAEHPNWQNQMEDCNQLELF